MVKDLFNLGFNMYRIFYFLVHVVLFRLNTNIYCTYLCVVNEIFVMCDSVCRTSFVKPKKGQTYTSYASFTMFTCTSKTKLLEVIELMVYILLRKSNY